MKNSKAAPSQWRKVTASTGEMHYLLTRKKVKRINLRVDWEGTIKVSLPYLLSAELADSFVLEKEEWLVKTRANLLAQRAKSLQTPGRSMEDLLKSFTDICIHWLPAFASHKVTMPEIRVRTLKSRWGSCHRKKGIVTLSSALGDVPFSCQEYVVVHELAHFVVPNHSLAFHALMAEIMPDYKARRQALHRHTVG